ncbi:hypothetical protein P7F88_17865 [Vibrio hannami]|uniref:hypothetical protein n=1 Tax=Vibrio hannami TaxID=2717094 RepID=UPI0024108149|nr:hypothetical protein [Vibrio hannami]MDG3087833.1 hypothetical protein [Vibrio hannami]
MKHIWSHFALPLCLSIFVVANDVTLSVLEGEGHFVLWQKPDLIVNEVIKAISRIE